MVSTSGNDDSEVWKSPSSNIRRQITKIINSRIKPVSKRLGTRINGAADIGEEKIVGALTQLDEVKDELDGHVDELELLYFDWDALIESLNEEDQEKEKDTRAKYETEKGIQSLRDSWAKLGDDYDEAKLNLGNKLPALKATQSTSVNLDQSTADKLAQALESFGHNGSGRTTNSDSSHIRLPTIQLQKFDGDSTQFAAFWNSFKYAVDSQGIPASDKFAYLNGCLSGKAAAVVRGFPFNESGYQLAVEALEKRFGNEANLVQDLYDRLAALRKPRAEFNSLQEFVDEVSQIYRLLKASNQVADHPLVEERIREKLPIEVVREVARLKLHSASDDWSVDKLIECLQDCVKLQSETTRFGDKPIPRNDRLGLYCCFCEMNGHLSIDCPRYTTLIDRQRALLNNNRCNRCLSKEHLRNRCSSSFTCPRCKGKHHRAVCPENWSVSRGNSFTRERRIEPRFPKRPNGPSVATGANRVGLNLMKEKQTSGAVGNHRKVQMMTVEVSVREGNHCAETILMFDSGSEASFIDRDLANKLGLKVSQTQTMRIQPFKTGPIAIETSQVTVKIRGKSGDEVEAELWVIDDLQSSLGLDHNGNPIEILIGIDQWAEFEIERLSEKVVGGQFHYKSRVGEFSAGKSAGKSNQSEEMKRVAFIRPGQSDLIENEQELISQLYGWESFGLGKELDMSVVDKKVWATVDGSLNFDGERFVAALPWIDESCEIPTNYGLCIGRLRSLIKRWKDVPEVFAAYQDTIENQLQKGVIEKVSGPPKGRVHYLAHHPVVKESAATTKVRIVYDGSAKTSKTCRSLNELLHRGPVVLSNLIGVVLRLRHERFVVSGDLEKAFLQVGVREEDRDSLRFLWIKNAEKPVCSENVEVFRFCRVPFGLTCSSFMLAAVVLHILNKPETELSREILENLYVDNLFLAGENEQELMDKAMKARELFLQAGMNLREFASNSGRLTQHFGSELRASKEEIGLLGIGWNCRSDLLAVKLPEIACSNPTKRKIMSLVAAVFDPLGWISPCLLSPRHLIQKLWLNGFDWDQPLEGELLLEWQAIESSWQKHKFEFPRHLGYESNDSELHIFCDASQMAVGAVAYGRNTESGETNLLMSKCKLAPHKAKLTINKLELLSVEIAVKLGSFIRKELPKVKRIIVWSDSACSLGWIHGRVSKEVYVRNRVNAIRAVEGIEFRHVAGNCNPADIVSRGMDVERLIGSEIWWKGPDFLRQESDWPKGWEFQADQLNEIPTVSVNINRETEFSLNVTGFDCWEALHEKAKELASIEGNDSEIIRQAYDFAIRQDQLQFPPTEREIEIFDVKEDTNGVKRSYGRLANSSLEENTRIPIFLSKKSHALKLLVKNLHTQSHPNLSTTLLIMRESFCFRGGVPLIRRILKEVCEPCRRFMIRPFRRPAAPALPSERVNRSNPFTFVGIDLAGPFRVKKHNSEQKVWILLATCLAVRAVHLELLDTCSTEEVLLALRRLFAIYGKPSAIYSDKATYFEAANRTLKLAHQEEIDWEEVSNGCKEKGIEWVFATELAPWKGGFYERLIGVVKNCLRRAMRKGMSWNLLLTLVKEAEAIVNQRPILSQQLSTSDSEILRPIDFIAPNKNSFWRPTFDKETNEVEFLPGRIPTGQQLLASWSRSTRRVEHFWKLWQKDYLIALREQGRNSGNERDLGRTPIVGESVLLIEKENASRNDWKLGKVSKLFLGSDKICRSVEVTVGRKKFRRAPELLLPLERDSLENGVIDEDGADLDRNQEDGVLVSRLKLLDSRFEVTSFPITPHSFQIPEMSFDGDLVKQTEIMLNFEEKMEEDQVAQISIEEERRLLHLDGEDQPMEDDKPKEEGLAPISHQAVKDANDRVKEKATDPKHDSTPGRISSDSEESVEPKSSAKVKQKRSHPAKHRRPRADQPYVRILPDDNADRLHALRFVPTPIPGHHAFDPNFLQRFWASRSQSSVPPPVMNNSSSWMDLSHAPHLSSHGQMNGWRYL